MNELDKELDQVASRRGFVAATVAGFAVAAGAAVTVPIVAYLLEPLFRGAREVWRDLGPVDQFKVGETVEVSFQDPSPLPWAGQTAATAAWVRRDSDTDFTAFAVNCTHLGCPVNWVQGASLFLCPCHGGVFYADGRVAGGPPERELFRYPVRVENGRVELRPRGLQLV